MAFLSVSNDSARFLRFGISSTILSILSNSTVRHMEHVPMCVKRNERKLFVCVCVCVSTIIHNISQTHTQRKRGEISGFKHISNRFMTAALTHRQCSSDTLHKQRQTLTRWHGRAHRIALESEMLIVLALVQLGVPLGAI